MATPNELCPLCKGPRLQHCRRDDVWHPPPGGVARDEAIHQTRQVWDHAFTLALAAQGVEYEGLEKQRQRAMTAAAFADQVCVWREVEIGRRRSGDTCAAGPHHHLWDPHAVVRGEWPRRCLGCDRCEEHAGEKIRQRVGGAGA